MRLCARDPLACRRQFPKIDSRNRLPFIYLASRRIENHCISTLTKCEMRLSK